MESVKRIEELLERYFEAQTSLEEEKQLKAYFNQLEVAPHLQEYQPLFVQMFKAGQETYTKALPSTSKPKIYYLKWVAVAAVAVISFGVFFQPGTTSIEEAYTPEEIAAAEMALQLFSNNFNKGTQGLTYLTEFERNTNKFLPNE